MELLGAGIADGAIGADGIEGPVADESGSLFGSLVAGLGEFDNLTRGVYACMIARFQGADFPGRAGAAEVEVDESFEDGNI